MNVLWITNNILPELAKATGLPGSVSGSWLIDLSQKLSDDENINLAIAAVGGREYKKIAVGNITYYLLPGTGRNMLFYTKKYEKIWQEIKNDFKVDIVHLHGTEYSHGLSFLRANPDVRAVVSVQGIISRIKDVFFDGLPKGFALKYRTMRENLRFNGAYETYLLYKHNSKYEQEIFRRVKYANATNFWDATAAKQINPEIRCFDIKYNLREGFYVSDKWDNEKIIKYQIFTNPGLDTIKGLHILLKAVSMIKAKYPEVSLVVPIESDKNGNILVVNGYTKYISRQIKQFGLSDNVKFVGKLTESEMITYMLQSNLVVVPSAIESTGMVLQEAMHLGVPCIASYRGGMADFMLDKRSGYSYDFFDATYLAGRIESVFSDDNLAKTFSARAIERAEEAHNREKNVANYIDMYNYIYNEGDTNE